MMNDGNQQVLFYVLVGFFVLIGVSSLLVLLGVIKTADKGFRKWAVPGFVGAVTAAVIAAFRVAVMPMTAPITVTLRGADGASIANLTSGEYISRDPARVGPQTGSVVPVLGPGGWQVQLPGSVGNTVITLTLHDELKRDWASTSFYPNSVQQEVRVGAVTATAAPPRPTAWAMPGVAVVFAAEAGAQQAAPVRMNNYARRAADRYGRAYYDWRLFVDEQPTVLNQIASVDYALHPSFPNPFRSAADRARQFELLESGWGSFAVLVTIHYTNGRQARLSYWLDLSKPWPATDKHR